MVVGKQVDDLEVKVDGVAIGLVTIQVVGDAINLGGDCGLVVARELVIN